MSHHINITRIKAISRILKSIKKDVVFVGGATVSLYADSKSSEVRPTDDVVIELAAISKILFMFWKIIVMPKISFQIYQNSSKNILVKHSKI
jgi:hypothetical protein